MYVLSSHKQNAEGIQGQGNAAHALYSAYSLRTPHDLHATPPHGTAGNNAVSTHYATLRNTPQHTATHHTAHSGAHPATRRNTPQHTATQGSAQHGVYAATRRITPQQTAAQGTAHGSAHPASAAAHSATAATHYTSAQRPSPNPARYSSNSHKPAELWAHSLPPDSFVADLNRARLSANSTQPVELWTQLLPPKGFVADLQMDDSFQSPGNSPGDCYACFLWSHELAWWGICK